MNPTVAHRPNTIVRPQPTLEEQKQLANATAAALEMLAHRFAAQDGFAEQYLTHRKSALGAAGIVLHKEGLEFLLMHDPDRFDKLTDRLYDMMDPTIIHAEVGPSCESTKAQ